MIDQRARLAGYEERLNLIEGTVATHQRRLAQVDAAYQQEVTQARQHRAAQVSDLNASIARHGAAQEQLVAAAGALGVPLSEASSPAGGGNPDFERAGRGLQELRGRIAEVEALIHDDVRAAAAASADRKVSSRLYWDIGLLSLMSMLALLSAALGYLSGQGAEFAQSLAVLAGSSSVFFLFPSRSALAMWMHTRAGGEPRIAVLWRRQPLLAVMMLAAVGLGTLGYLMPSDEPGGGMGILALIVNAVGGIFWGFVVGLITRRAVRRSPARFGAAGTAFGRGGMAAFLILGAGQFGAFLSNVPAHGPSPFEGFTFFMAVVTIFVGRKWRRLADSQALVR